MAEGDRDARVHGIEAAARAGFRLRHQPLVADEAMVELEPLEGQAGQLQMDAQPSPDLVEAGHPAQALTAFSGYYAPANWTQSIQGDGSINTGGAPASIIFSGANDKNSLTALSQNTDFTIAAPSAGTVSFGWAFATADGAFTTPFAIS